MRLVAARLCAFYGEQPPAPFDAQALGALLLGHVQDAERDLSRPEGGLPAETVKSLCAAQRVDQACTGLEDRRRRMPA